MPFVNPVRLVGRDRATRTPTSEAIHVSWSRWHLLAVEVTPIRPRRG